MSYVTQVLKERKSFAVVGATVNREKYGYEIFKSLREAGYRVFPVNPKYERIEEVPCYPSLGDLPETPEVVVTVVPPEVTEKVVRNCVRLKVPVVWMPPGSSSEEAVRQAEENGLQVIHEVCLVFALKSLSFSP